MQISTTNHKRKLPQDFKKKFQKSVDANFIAKPPIIMLFEFVKNQSSPEDQPFKSQLFFKGNKDKKNKRKEKVNKYNKKYEKDIDDMYQTDKKANFFDKVFEAIVNSNQKMFKKVGEGKVIVKK